MNKQEFLKWIESLGFRQTWQSNPDEYSIFPKGEYFSSSPKLYIVTDIESFRAYYSDCSRFGITGVNIGYFRYSNLGDFEKYLLVTNFSEFFDELPNGFKEFIRDSKIKNILGD